MKSFVQTIVKNHVWRRFGGFDKNRRMISNRGHSPRHYSIRLETTYMTRKIKRMCWFNFRTMLIEYEQVQLILPRCVICIIYEVDLHTILTYIGAIVHIYL